jgi:hypothetical protein
MFACPSASCTIFGWTFLESINVAYVCLRSWKRTLRTSDLSRRLAKVSIVKIYDRLAQPARATDHTLYVRVLVLTLDGTVLTLGIGDLSWLR